MADARRDLDEDLRSFLRTRRARLTPAEVGLVDYGTRRRVPGLRRDEVARLANISIEYYTRMERGNGRGVSDEVLDSVAGALRLDEVERAHLYELVRHGGAARPADRRKAPDRVEPSMFDVLDAFTGAPAFVRNSRLDVVAANQLARALYADAFDTRDAQVNLARFIYFDERSRTFYRDWAGIAGNAVGTLRTQAARNPADRALSELVGELSIRSDEFRARWAEHNVKRYAAGVQRFHHASVGDLELDYNAFDLVAAPGLTLITYTAAVGTTSRAALDRLTRIEA